jgi:hypothetical protein
MRDRLGLWLSLEVAGRKWIIWVLLIFVVMCTIMIVLGSLPRSAINAWLEHDEASNGLRPR